MPPHRPYVRTPPLEKDHHYRMAWVGSTSIYDRAGNELHTWWYAAEASADPTSVASRIAADVAWIARAHRDVPIHCVQDGAPELKALPAALTSVLPGNHIPVVLVDFEHLMGYLDAVVDACEPDGDPRNCKGWYRSALLRDDAAIDRIWRQLRRRAATACSRVSLPRSAMPPCSRVASRWNCASTAPAPPRTSTCASRDRRMTCSHASTRWPNSTSATS